MPKYHRFERPMKASVVGSPWFEQRLEIRELVTGTLVLRIRARMCCEECAEPISPTQFVQGEGLCLRCSARLQG